MPREVIKSWNGTICGFVETDSQGNKVAKTERGRIVGYYKKNLNITTDERGRRKTVGDTVVSLIPIHEKP